MRQCGHTIKEHKYFDFFILLPKFVSLQQQTVTRLKEFIHSIQQLHLTNSNNNSLTHNYHCFLRDIQANLNESQVHNRVIRLGTQAKKTNVVKQHRVRRNVPVENRQNETDKLLRKQIDVTD